MSQDEFFKELLNKVARSKEGIEKAVKEKNLANLMEELEVFKRIEKMCKSLMNKG